MVVLIDNTDNDVDADIVISDDGTGSDINIPTVMINKKNGTVIVDFMLSNPDKPVIFA